MCVVCIVCVPAEPVAWSSLCIPLTTHLHPAGGNEGNHPGDQLWEEMRWREGEGTVDTEGEGGGEERGCVYHFNNTTPASSQLYYC